MYTSVCVCVDEQPMVWYVRDFLVVWLEEVNNGGRQIQECYIFRLARSNE